MINKISNEQIQKFLEKPTPKQPDSPNKSQNNEIDASLQVNFGDFIEKTKQNPQADSAAVERAQELLSSGQLDSKENIREAAENIVKFGI